MTETEPMPASQMQAASELDRLAMQASAADDGLDPTSMAGQYAAMLRGDPVQLVGEEGLAGIRWGVSTTTNESAMLASEGSIIMTQPQDREAVAEEVLGQHADDMKAMEDEAAAADKAAAAEDKTAAPKTAKK